ncbi:hypothetical protein NH621_04415 [Lactococcus formosensis]|uniref:DUF7339 family protein n=1 Tax=Lactococcus formosensis TaxID=1281486 RepID=UPI00209707A2|nr:hypothetical protein [Lactococcus formosensis]MCO7180426.1 hypothetical protein [Lactococcus formosensis]
MIPEQFWEKIDSYCKENNLSKQGLCKAAGIHENYLSQLKKKKNKLPPAKKIIKFHQAFTDDEIFEIMMNSDSIEEEDEHILFSLNISKEARMRNRIKRKIQRGETT